MLDAQDKEKIAVGNALGLKLNSLKDIIVRIYGHMGASGNTLYEIIKNNQAHVAYRPRKALNDMTVVFYEDIPHGLVPISSIGNMLGISTPTIDALIHLAGIVSGINYWKTGSTVKKIGLAGMKAKEIVNYANTGAK